ncbi:MAG: VanZ family protein [Thioalkalispiraceae bacterium]|jgi:VanZ family protein
MKLYYHIFKSRIAFAFVGIAIFVGLFILKEDLIVSRLGNEMWNLLHLCAFFIIWLFLVNLFSFFRPDRLPTIGKIILLTVVASILIEVIQSYIGRDASIEDIALNLAGTLLALIVTIYKGQYFKGRSYYIYFIFIVFTIMLVWPGIRIFIDEIQRREQFPVLADFSKPYELGRWSSNHAKLSISSTSLGKVLDVTLLPGSRYSTVTLHTIHEDWEQYRELMIVIVNNENTKLPLVLRINDAAHNNEYSDRYNKRREVPEGLSTITVKLLDLYNAPKGRRMDLNNIQAISLFAIDLNSTRKFQIKKIYLR